MAPRTPLSSDFPSLTLTIIPPPSTPPSATQPLNILILLHGLGDTQTPFASFGRALNLPSTTCISLCAASPVPAFFTGTDAPSFHWGDDIVFDEGKGEIDADAGFERAGKMLESVVRVLRERCGYDDRAICWLGFGQGGMAALSLAASASFGDTEFGGVISIGGKLPSSGIGGGNGKAKTPVLLCGGSKSREVTRSSIDAIRERFGEVEYVRWGKAGDGMPSNREEMLPIMKFLARRLRSRAGVPEGAVEI